MTSSNQLSRRSAFKTSALALFGLSVPEIAAMSQFTTRPVTRTSKTDIPEHFPHMDPEVVADVVGKSHFDLEAVMALVDPRPELARSVWEWRFGDFESAIGAASHVGRRDIASYLMEMGARPTIFTFAMFGHYDAVSSMYTAFPGIQRTQGPHGISLLDHAYAGEHMKEQMTSAEIDNLKRTIDFLESLGDAGGDQYIDVSPEEQQKYLGDYMYGSGEKDGFTVDVNMRKLLSLGPIGEFGGSLYKIAENKFIYNGAPSVNISFEIKEEVVRSLTLTEPNLRVVAEKVS